MADPVAQILEQAQNVSGGAPFGDFFVRGVQSAQQDRQLDQADRGLNLEEELNTARIQDLGAKAVAGRAAQKLKLNQQLLSGPTAQKVQDWINRDSPMEELGDVVATLSNLNEDDPVREFGMKHVSMVSAAEDAAAERDAIRKEDEANFPTPEQQTEAKKNIIRVIGPDANISINSKGEVFGSSPTGKTVTSRFNTKTGVWETTETTGSLGPKSSAALTASQTIIQSSEQLRGAIAKTRQLAVVGNVGIQGAAKRSFNKFLAPVYEAFTGKSALYASVEELDNNVAEMQLSIMSSLKPDAQMSEKELAILARMFPTAGISDTAEGLNIKLDHIERLNNMRDYLHRRNSGMIPERQFFERMLDQPNGNKQISRFLSDLREAGLMSDNEIRVSLDRIRAIRESR